MKKLMNILGLQGSSRQKTAFTLAEVLITLGIIGVVAALTLPNLVQQHKDKVKIAKVKKAYSALSNAYAMITTEYGNVDNWGLPQYGYTSNEYARGVAEKFIGVMPVTKTCLNRGDFDKCFARVGGTNFLDGVGIAGASYSTFRTGDITYGIRPYFDDLSNNAGFKRKLYAQIEVFVEPHLKTSASFVYGKNIFPFFLTDKGILPAGIGKYKDYNSYSPLPFDVYCVTGGGALGRGFGCTAWVLKNENFDYLKCPKKIASENVLSCK